jgi:hypothetical protein
MAGDEDLYQQQWNLRPRIDALRAEAKSLRERNNAQYKTNETDMGIERDRIARERYGVEQTAKSADMQVKAEQKDLDKIAKEIAAREADAVAAERRGDTSAAAEHREYIAGARASQAAHEARARQATLDAAELREQQAGVDRRLTEVEVRRTDLSKQTWAAEQEIDKLEQQADLLQQARLKWAEADIAGDDVGRRSTLSLEAEALVTKAGGIDVDRSVLRVVIPDVPDTTPGIDDAPGPLPEGAIDWSEYIDTSAVTSDVLGGEAVATIGQDAPDADQPEADAVVGSDDSSDVVGSAAATFDEQPVEERSLTFEQPAAFADDTSFSDTSSFEPASFESSSMPDESFAVDAATTSDSETSFDV